MKEVKNYRFPVVMRLVQGSVYTPFSNDKFNNGERVFKSGAHKGEERKEYFFRCAIRKGRETHWSETPWGKMIKDVAVDNWGEHVFRGSKFASKVVDGDSTEANMEGVRLCDNEGFKGHWIVRFQTGFPVKVVDDTGRKELTEKEFVKCGYFIEVLTNIRSNGSQQTPGIFLNPLMISFRAFGPRIENEYLDPASVGFGQAPLPEGATQEPTPSSAKLEEFEEPMPWGAEKKKQMTSKAKGTYENYVAMGYTDEDLVRDGLMIYV